MRGEMVRPYELRLIFAESGKETCTKTGIMELLDRIAISKKCVS